MSPVVGGLVRIRCNNIFTSSASLLIQPKRCFASRPWRLPFSPVSAATCRCNRSAKIPERLGRHGLSHPSRSHATINPSSLVSDTDSKVGIENEPKGKSKPLPSYQPQQYDNSLAFTQSCLGIGYEEYSPYKDVIFAALDTEFTPTKITEVGLAILDPRDIKGLHPGKGTISWCRYIESHHYRLTPYANRPFLFGVTSETPPATMSSNLASIFQPDRAYVLVGHSLQGDIEKIAQIIGYDLRSMVNVVAVVDTYTLALRSGDTLPQRLKKLWQHLAPDPFQLIRQLSPKHYQLYKGTNLYFHNAGNDAFYTLHSLLLLAVKNAHLDSDLLPSQTGIMARVRYLLAWYLPLRLRRGLKKLLPSNTDGHMQQPHLKTYFGPPKHLVFAQPLCIKESKGVSRRFKPADMNAPE